ncbi:MAG: hypothetical protein LBF66_03345 [Holosporales bacterium]|jgi:hypothetical protein|nr:hypothetical protein [Holosporales bacterium]
MPKNLTFVNGYKKRLLIILGVSCLLCEARGAIDWQREVKRQGVIRQIVAKIANREDVLNEVQALLKAAKSKDDIFLAGMLSGSLVFNEAGETKKNVARTAIPPSLTSFEIDMLWMKGSSDFLDNVAIYLAGKLLSFQIFSKCLNIDDDSTENRGRTQRGSEQERAPNRCSSIDEKELKDICLELYYNLASDPENRYLKHILSKITSKRTISNINKWLTDPTNISASQAFCIIVESEYALKWLNAYIASPNKRAIYERMLTSLEPESLQLAALRALNGPNAYPKALAAYTFAGAKEKKARDELGEFVEFLIKNRQAQAFEVFCPPSSALK